MNKNSRKGFTLIEYIIVILIVGVIAAVLGTLIIQGVRAFDSIAAREALMTEAEAAAERMSREMRNAGRPSDIVEADWNTFYFTDIYGDGIKYHIEGKFLMRNEKILAANLKSAEFSYFDRQNTQITPPLSEESFEDIHLVGIKLVFSNRGQETAIETKIRPRNFR